MKRCPVWIAVLGVASGTAGLAAPMPGVGAPQAAVPASAAAEAITAAEDVAVLKGLAPLGLSRSQLAQLLPALQGAQASLAALDQEEAAKLAGMRGSLEQAKRDLLAGKGSGTSAQGQFALAQSAAAQRRARLRADLVAGLRRTLASILSPAQAEQMAQSGQAVAISQRTASWRGGGGRGDRGGGRGGPGAERGGPGGRMTSRLDRVREMSPADFEQEHRRFAERLGGESSPRFQQFMSFMNRVRTMPHSQYLLQRDQLAAQSMAQMGGGFGPGMAASSDEAAHAFVDRYLLSPRAPVVVNDRLRSPQ